MDLSTTVKEIRAFVHQNVMELRGVLRQQLELAKPALASLIGRLVLTPLDTQSGPVYEVSGGIDLLAGKDVMPLVARRNRTAAASLFRAAYRQR